MHLLLMDLDGTTLTCDGRVPCNMLDFFEFARTHKITPCIATSRSPDNVAELFRGYSGLFAICSDGGTSIRLTDEWYEVLDEILLGPDVVKRVTEFMQVANRGLELFCFGDKLSSFAVHHLSNTATNSLAFYETYLGDSRPVVRHTDLLSLNAGQAPMRAISWLAPLELVRIPAKDVSDFARSQGAKVLMYRETRVAPIRVEADTDSDYYWVDVVNQDLDKATAAERLSRKLEVDGKILAFGNGVNDLGMFRMSSLSLAPLGCAVEVAAAASLVADGECGDAFLAAAMDIIADWSQHVPRR